MMLPPRSQVIEAVNLELHRNVQQLLAALEAADERIAALEAALRELLTECSGVGVPGTTTYNPAFRQARAALGVGP